MVGDGMAEDGIAEGAVEVLREIEVAASPAQVWGVIGGFDDLPRWLPPVRTSEPDTAHGRRYRKLTTVDDGFVLEELLGHDDAAMRYSYTIIDGVLPVENYRSTLSAEVSGDGTLVVWQGRFDPKGATEAEAAVVIEGIYEAGLTRIKSLLEH